MGGCFGDSQIDRYLESQVLEYCGGDQRKRAKCLRVPPCAKGADGVCYSGFYCVDRDEDYEYE